MPYECDPDCDERSNCLYIGKVGHSQCGRCDECSEPRHHGCLTTCRKSRDAEAGAR